MIEVRDPTPDEREWMKEWRTVAEFAARFSFKPEESLSTEHVNWLFGEWVERGILEVFDPQITGVKFRLAR